MIGRTACGATLPTPLIWSRTAVRLYWGYSMMYNRPAVRLQNDALRE